MNTKRNGLKFCHGILAALLTFSVSSAEADDTEVFVNTFLSGIAPNLIFSLDLSGSMNKMPDGNSGSPTRLSILQDAMTQIMNDPGLPDINVGFTYFRNNQGSGIKFPASRLVADASTIDGSIPPGTLVRDVLQGMVAATNANYATPTVDSYYEVAQYIRGEYPTFGVNQNFGSWNSGSMQYTGGSSSGGMNDGWLAANPVSYTGGVNYVPLAHPSGWNSTCDDRSVSSPAGSDGCSSQRNAGAELSCGSVAVPATSPTPSQPARVCSASQCDSGCGTVCTDRTYTEPSNCIQNSSGNTWVTGTSGGEPRRCCTKADSGLNECIEDRSYPSVCNASTCNTNNAHGVIPGTPGTAATSFDRCTYRREDTRQYISPITQQCQKTAVVLLTDGDPSVNNVDRGEVNGSGNAVWPYRIREKIASNDGNPMTNTSSIVCDDYSDEFGAAPGDHPYGNCAKEFAAFLHNNDQVSTLPGSTVDTYAIGFGLTGPSAAATWGYLQDITAAGGGEAFEASDLSSLVAAFQNIIASISSDNQSFSGYATSLNTSTLQTGDKTYRSVFSPENERAWDGNIKGYYIIDGTIKDVNGTDATEIDSGSGDVVFKSSARSFWSNAPDGNAALSGGVIDKLTPATRNIYVITNPAEVANVNLSDGNHDMKTSNANLTAALMGMPLASTPAEVADMITWARSRRMGDPLHAEPRTIRYGAGIGEVLYVSTNQGYLHAINVTSPTSPGDTAGGNEMFAFMPNQLVGKLQEQRADNVAGAHIYGLDGSMTTWALDTDGNGIIDNASDRAYLFFGMRRGGGSYFAMDVTNPNAPKLKWQINAGSPGYELLGQSWSRMSLATINDGGSPRKVLIFGGGYDAPRQDVPNTARDPLGDYVGMGIYIVDAETGALLNSIGADDPGTSGTQEFAVDVPGMKYSMPADVRAEDSDSNGYTDRLYAVDTGGQIWRVDLIEGASIAAAASVKPYLFADLSGSGVAGNRRFFYPPSVAYTTRNNATVTALAIGSGYRAHPLNTAIDDEFYILFDTEVGVGPPAITPPALTTASLYDGSSNTIQTATGATLAAELAALNAAGGWRITLPGDQKVLVRSRIFRNHVFFNTFESGVANPCDFSGGTNRFYGVKLLDATGVLEIDVDNDGTPDVVDRTTVVDDQAAILSEPTIVTHAETGTPTTPDPFCSTVFAGSTAVMQICEAPVRVNWQTLQ